MLLTVVAHAVNSFGCWLLKQREYSLLVAKITSSLLPMCLPFRYDIMVIIACTESIILFFLGKISL